MLDSWIYASDGFPSPILANSKNNKHTMIHIKSTGIYSTPSPIAYITMGKNRLKMYGSLVDTLYMKPQTNFEIEMFNPTSKEVLAKISIDGTLISSTGIVLKPGQRVFLERWIDDNKKFIFSTYEVEKSKEALKAISENGKIKIEFFDEYQKPFNTYTPNTWIQPWNVQPYTNPYIYNGGVFCGTTTSTGTAIISGNSTLSCNASNSSNNTSFDFSNCINDGQATLDSIETGRTEQGAASDQAFSYTNGNFNSWPIVSMTYQILPESVKPIEVENLRKYCTSCGTRTRNTSWKFCPSCGEKI